MLNIVHEESNILNADCGNGIQSVELVKTENTMTSVNIWESSNLVIIVKNFIHM